jgi:hypothetical protein
MGHWTLTLLEDNMANLPESERFDAIAKEYDLWPLVDPAYDVLHSRFIEVVKQEIGRMNRPENQRIEVMEIGFGTGHTTKLLLQCDPRIHVIGFEPSEEMYNQSAGRDLCPDKAIWGRFNPVLEGVLEASTHHRFPSATIVGSVCTMHNIPPVERLAVCRWAFNQLERGGLYISADKVAVNDPAQYLIMWDRWVRDFEGFRERGLHNSYNYWRLHELEDHLNRITEAETEAMLKTAGFQAVATLCRVNMYTITVGRKPILTPVPIQPSAAS